MSDTRVTSSARINSRTYGRRIGVISAAAACAFVCGGGAASAGADSVSSIVDSKGNRIEVYQRETSIAVYPPLDSSPLSVEFFHDGIAGVKIDGPDAASFTGTELTIGYQIGYPIALTGATVVLNSPGLSWGVERGTTLDVGISPQLPNIDIGGGSTPDPGSGGSGSNGDSSVPDVEIDPNTLNPDLGAGVSNTFVLGGDIIPSQELDVDLAPGGITDVALLSNQKFDGPEAAVRLSGIHGYVQGAVGPVTIRPYAKAVTSKGDTVVTYGAPQRLKG